LEICALPHIFSFFETMSSSRPAGQCPLRLRAVPADFRFVRIVQAVVDRANNRVQPEGAIRGLDDDRNVVEFAVYGASGYTCGRGLRKPTKNDDKCDPNPLHFPTLAFKEKLNIYQNIALAIGMRNLVAENGSAENYAA
jgi:hypothetical protein